MNFCWRSPNPKSIPDSQAPGSAQACPGRNADSILANINNPGCVANAGLGVLERSPTADFTLGVGPDGIQRVDNHFYGASSDVEVRLPGVLVSSITAYEAYHNDFGMDYDGTVEPILNLHYIRNLHQYSQELRLSGDIGNTHWLAGTYASYEDLNQNLLYFCGFLNPATLTGSCNYFGAPARAPATAPEPTRNANSVGSDWDRGTTTAAVFSHNEISLAPRWSAVIGGRYTYDRAAFSGRGFVVYQDGSEQVNNQGGLGPAIGESSLTVHKFTGSVGLNFKPSEKVLAYVSYGEGFKSGGYDGSILNNITALTSPYKPETVDALEIGVKSEPVSHMRINASTFYERYRDPQERISTILPLPGGGTLPTTTLSNLHRATIYGLELETVWMPTSAISLGSYLTYYHSRVDQPFDPANPSLSQRFNGNELAGAAPVSAVVYGKYDWHFDSRYKLQFSANAKYLDTSFTTVENYGTSRQPAYTLVSARASLIDSSGWEVSVWGKNLLNTAYTTVTFLGFGSDTYYPADPLTWGVELRYVF
jgi:iron complex outermembrane recepter protein